MRVKFATRNRPVSGRMFNSIPNIEGPILGSRSRNCSDYKSHMVGQPASRKVSASHNQYTVYTRRQSPNQALRLYLFVIRNSQHLNGMGDLLYGAEVFEDGVAGDLDSCGLRPIPYLSYVLFLYMVLLCHGSYGLVVWASNPCNGYSILALLLHYQVFILILYYIACRQT